MTARPITAREADALFRVAVYMRQQAAALDPGSGIRRGLFSQADTLQLSAEERGPQDWRQLDLVSVEA